MPTRLLPAFSPSNAESENIANRLESAATAKRGAEREAKLKNACQGFEAIFLNTILQEMRKSIADDGILPTSSAMRTWQQLFDNQLAESLASRQEMGVAKMLYQQLQEMEGDKNFK
ncbi:MAG: rod-binding protein [Deltaproteobacteria bacterium]|nr:rod-binding protein [Deltaproteobacteria bacterium]